MSNLQSSLLHRTLEQQGTTLPLLSGEASEAALGWFLVTRADQLSNPEDDWGGQIAPSGARSQAIKRCVSPLSYWWLGNLHFGYCHKR
jgi:hypothetical protein